MATAYLVQAPYSTALDANGTPISGAQISTFAAGTTTPQVTYTDSTGTVAAANPIIADAAGRYVIWANVSLKVTVADAAGIPIRTTDNITPTGTVPANSVSNSGLAQAPAYTVKGNNTGSTANVTDLTAIQLQALLGKVPTTITGYLPTAQTFTSATVASMSISSGITNDSSNAALLASGALTWNITNGNAANGFQSGTTLPNSSTIHFFVIANSALTTFASFASTLVGPTLPAGYTYYRRIMSIPTNASGVLLLAAAPFGTPQGIEVEGGSLLYYYGTQILDIAVTNLGTTRVNYNLTLPTGITVEVKGRCVGSTGPSILLMSGTENDLAVTTSLTTAPLSDMQNNTTVGSAQLGRNFLTTTTSGQISARASSGTTNSLYFVTSGFIDYRR